ncbi:divalent-cation tolerance protein CutA [Stigmatella aurantiaca]|uniref:Divalent cation tolerance protein n=1 Tax=Stigmatella aurantiaca (strain DW4/3-1) TaxID=378806 RepID=Q093K9_STIAD|nr:divalent-cation tolerance protein CutA [Stigmatella aurantiaca]ADO72708.1 Divalent ion tolerance protein [Stigmatella aurantiaca DW4/3-1]EAU66913.1 divalent cation tolerance protein [Stigmatella aurantiaca DW4/3-1]
MTDVILVLVTCPTAEVASTIARTLVEETWVACGNILPAIRSIYRWQGQVQDEPECLLMLKTRSELFEQVRERLLALHPYEVPEMLALRPEAGHRAYLDWVLGMTKAPGTDGRSTP